MSSALWLIFASFFSFVAMTWLAVAMPIHHKQIKSNLTPNTLKTPLIRFLAVLALGVSAFCCLMADHFSMAILVWVLLLIISGISVGMILSFRPKLLSILTFSLFEKTN